MCPSKKESFNFYLKYFLIFFQKTNDIFQVINLQSVRKKNESIKLYSKGKKKKSTDSKTFPFQYIDKTFSYKIYYL